MMSYTMPRSTTNQGWVFGRVLAQVLIETSGVSSPSTPLLAGLKNMGIQINIFAKNAV